MTTYSSEPDFGAVSNSDLELLANFTSGLIDTIEDSGVRLPRAYGRLLRRLEIEIADEMTRRGLLSENELIEVDVEVILIPADFDDLDVLTGKSPFADFVNSLDLDDFEDDGNE